MEVQTVEKKPVAGKQTVTATEETSAVAERTKEVIIPVATIDYANTRRLCSPDPRTIDVTQYCCTQNVCSPHISQL